MDLDIILIIIGAVFSAVMISVAWFINHRTHPKALWLLFFTEMWERFSFYGMRALLILYMTKVLGFHDKEANLQYGAYNALVYTMPLIGGWIADRYLGFRKSITLGAIIMALGHLVLAIPSETTFFFGLGLLISGNGFFKPNISSFLGRFYETNDPRKDTAYSIFYMGINIGAFLGGSICGYLGEKVSWHLGFGIAGIFMVLGLIIFVSFRKVLGDAGHPPPPVDPQQPRRPLWPWYAVAAGLVPVSMLLVKRHTITDILLPVLGVVSLGYIIWLGSRMSAEARTAFQLAAPAGAAPADMERDIKESQQKLWAALIMIVLSVVFWGFFEQSGGMLNLVADRNVDMQVGDTKLQSAMVNNALNPFFIILLTPLFAWIWGALGRRNWLPAAPVKFGIAFLLMGVGYWVFFMGGKAGGVSGMMPLLFFVAGYFFMTASELFLSPIGLSMVSKLSPARMVGLMMGMWFLASAFGHHLAGWVGSTMAIPKEEKGGAVLSAVESMGIYMGGFEKIALVSLAGGVVILAVSPFIKRWMHGVK
jgi:proton-dependent oligopeptide transporter, POT family